MTSPGKTETGIYSSPLVVHVAAVSCIVFHLVGQLQGWCQKFPDTGSGTSERGKKMTQDAVFTHLFWQIHTMDNPMFPPTEARCF